MLIVLLVVRMDTPMAAKGKTLREKVLQLDPLGNVLFISSLICLLLALQWGGITYAWNSGRIIALLVIFALVFVAWTASQVFRGVERVLVPLHLLKNRSILAGMWYSLFCNSAMVISALYLPVYFQAIKGVDAVQSGIRVIPLILGMVIMIVGSGIMTSKIGYYTPFMILGSILAPIGAGLLTTLQVDSGHSKWIGYEALLGLGLGLGMQQSMLAAQTVLARRDGPQGSSLMILCQMLGGAIFASVAQNVLDQRLVSNLASANIPGIDPKSIVSIGATQVRALIPAKYFAEFLGLYNEAISKALTVSVCTASLTIIGALAMEWKSTKKGGPPGPGGQGPPGPPVKPAEATMVEKKEADSDKSAEVV